MLLEVRYQAYSFIVINAQRSVWSRNMTYQNQVLKFYLLKEHAVS